MRKTWITVGLAGLAGLSFMVNVAFATGVAKVELDAVPFRWMVGGKTFSSETPYNDGETNLPSSLNYKGTTYVPIRLAAQSLGYRVEWNDKTKTAVVSAENEDDPMADQPDSNGNYPNYKFVPAQADAPAWERKADTILTLGMTYMGTPYDFGAPLGQTESFDCSSFLNYIFGEKGIKLPRNSRQQSEVGTEIGLDQIRKGDLLFFTTPKRKDKTGTERIGHVSVYLGDNKMLHTYRTGIGVVVSELDERWKGRLIKGKRVIQ
ncbi:C40 family peptidase [Paenibacillus mesophilus]|uniref:C40 family peptidase n=1 Tax=Paenibacillus mesophilus TaxID=2582849 RepID=UPI0013051974|nr:C40 family peptidase [Paenibacillus mesophilus]